MDDVFVSTIDILYSVNEGSYLQNKTLVLLGIAEMWGDHPALIVLDTFLTVDIPAKSMYFNIIMSFGGQCHHQRHLK